MAGGEFLSKASPWLAAIEAAGSIGLGAYQMSQAKKLQKGMKPLPPRPVYEYNDAKQAVAGQLNLAQGEAPGLTQQMQGVNQSLANTTQSINNMAPSGAAGLGALVQAGAGTQQTVADLLANASQQKLGLQQNYLKGKAGLQQYADNAFQINQMDPYNQKREELDALKNEIAAMKNASLQNIFGGVSAGIDTATLAGASKSLKSGEVNSDVINQILEGMMAQGKNKNIIA